MDKKYYDLLTKYGVIDENGKVSANAKSALLGTELALEESFQSEGLISSEEDVNMLRKITGSVFSSTITNINTILEKYYTYGIVFDNSTFDFETDSLVLYVTVPKGSEFKTEEDEPFCGEIMAKKLKEEIENSYIFNNLSVSVKYKITPMYWDHNCMNMAKKVIAH